MKQQCNSVHPYEIERTRSFFMHTTKTHIHTHTHTHTHTHRCNKRTKFCWQFNSEENRQKNIATAKPNTSSTWNRLTITPPPFSALRPAFDFWPVTSSLCFRFASSFWSLQVKSKSETETVPDQERIGLKKMFYPKTTASNPLQSGKWSMRLPEVFFHPVDRHWQVFGRVDLLQLSDVLGEWQVICLSCSLLERERERKKECVKHRIWGSCIPKLVFSTFSQSSAILNPVFFL